MVVKVTGMEINHKYEERNPWFIHPGNLEPFDKMIDLVFFFFFDGHFIRQQYLVAHVGRMIQVEVESKFGNKNASHNGCCLNL